MLTINMFSSADKVKGQGVGSVYLDLIKMLKTECQDSFDIRINQYKKSDISHYHTVDFKFYLSTFFKKHRGRRIGYVHFVPETLEGSLDLPWIAKVVFYRYLIAFYKRMDHLVVVNPSFIPILERYGIPKEKVTYIPNFVSKSLFYPCTAEEKSAFRKEKGFKEEDFIVLGAGQIQERKGVDDFIKLAQNNPHIQFVWAGGFSFGKMTSGYEKYKEIYENPPQNLTFTGIIPRDELNYYYNSTDLFLLPSFNELFPMSILEAFNCETPVMLRELELYHSIIQDYYIPAADYEEMQLKINELNDQREQLAKFKEKSKQAAYKYSEESLSRVWHDFYIDQAAKYHYSVQDETSG